MRLPPIPPRGRPVSRRPDPPLRRLGPRLSRRGLITSGVLAGVLAVSGVPVAARARGGVLRLGLAGPVPAGPGDWDTRGPALMGLASGLVAETLTEIGPQGELLPGLAAAWEADGTARDWVFRLAPGARFHDGRAVAPADALLSLERHRAGSPLSGLLGGVVDARADGPGAIRLRLREGDPDLPLRLADPRLAVWREGRPDGTGTGLYRLDTDAAPGTPPDAPPGTLRARRVPSHRRDGQAGFFDAVEARSLPDPRARLEALLAGEADAVDPLPPGLEAEAAAAGMALASALGLPARTPHVPGLAHGPVSGLGPLDGGRIAERWWFAA